MPSVVAETRALIDALGLHQPVRWGHSDGAGIAVLMALGDPDRIRAVILEAEGSRQSAILKAEGEKQSAILEAEGSREAAFREAEARERAAQAEANATKAVSDAIEQGSAQAINYFVAQKYVEAIAQFARSPNAKTILFPVEATQLIGTLGGIGELAKEAIGIPASPTKAKSAPSVPKAGE